MKIEKQIGLDLDIKDLCITSNAKKYENPKIVGNYEKKLAKLKRQLSHKEKGSSSYFKPEKIALCYERIVNIRRDYLRDIFYEIISENQVIVGENLQIKNMIKNYHMTKTILDVSRNEFQRQLEYKALWNKREYVEVKKLSIRKWICSVCGAEHDRDVNAAKNIFMEELRQTA
ncbi:MAG: transposase [Lachnospiraceae bacterium]